MLQSISKINELVEKLWSLQPIKAEFQERINRKVRLEFNYNSNHIEGNTLTYGETKLLFMFDKTTGNHDLREYEEMKAHDVAFELVKEMAADKERPLSESSIRHLHEVLLVRPYWRDAVTGSGEPSRKQIQIGVYKTAPNHVKLLDGTIFHYASPEDTPAMMAEMINWYRMEEEAGELHPLQLAALLHYRFVRIHPFDDGNGRLSRLLMNYVLLRANYPPAIIKSADKKNYLFALNQADVGDLDTFVQYVGEQLIWSLELYIDGANGGMLDELEELKEVINRWRRQRFDSPSDIAHLYNLTIYHACKNSKIEDLIKLITENITVFYPLFRRHSLDVLLNGVKIAEPDGLNLEMEHKLKDYNNSHHEDVLTELVKEICIEIKLVDYLHGEVTPFSVQTKITINFQPHSYEVGIDNEKVNEWKYNEYLTSDDRTAIVSTTIRRIFERVKQLAASYPEG
ncbi:Fic family protein [Chitinophaga sp. Cy-1792]|uniref:Fic family protein n=1 Tax=Chitinophaga sp. Cy-1792 TaxID=2608339 RepID=UPI00141FF1D8|nr:Fic family protein [Chitinophaga sp. Cy-1792]NIG52480.1 Fic family protein [Chitinophaga sp. Cy-1792]